MFQTLLLLGIACVIAAVVGGGLQIAGVGGLPVVDSVARQVLLAVVGVVIIVGDIVFIGPEDDRAPQPKEAGLPSDCVAELRATAAEASGDGSPTRQVTVKVDPGPAAIAIARQYAWVAHTDGKVTRIPLGTRGGRADPQPGVQVGSENERGQVSIAYGMGFAWMIKREGDRGFLAKIGRTRVSKEIRLDAPDNVAVGGGSVWVTDDDGRLSQWAPSNLRRVSTQDLHADPHGLWAGGRCVYVATTSPNGFIAFDAETSKRIRVFTVQGANEIAGGAGALWLTDITGKRLLRVDPREPSKAQAVPVGITPAVDALAAGKHGVWTSDGSRIVVRVAPYGEGDPATITLNGEPVGIAVDAGDPELVWVAREASAEITRLGP